MFDKYVLDGKFPVLEPNITRWEYWFEKSDRRVAFDVVNDSEVSTVFLGIDHNFYGENRPILFETMVFGGKLDQEQERYSTWEEAEEGHKRMVEKVKNEHQRP